jgi:MFS family permease
MGKNRRPSREKPVSRASFRLACLWLSQTARVLADWCLRLFVWLELARLGKRELNSAWYLVTAVFITPFIFLAPTNGALSNALRKRWVLVASASLCLAATALFGAAGDPWHLCVCLFLVAAGTAVYSPTRYALLPAAAHDTRIPLARVTSWIEMGGAVGLVGGAILGRYLHDVTWADLSAPELPVPVAVAVALAFSAVTVLTALPVRFASDTSRPEPPLRAVAGFFRDARRVLASRPARGSLLGLALLMALVTAGAGALLNYTLDPAFADDKAALLWSMVVIAVGGAAGSWLAGLQGNLRRCLALVPFACTGLLTALAWATAVRNPMWPCLLLGLMTGLANVPLRSFYQASVPADARGNGMAIMNTAIFTSTTLLSVLMFLLAYFRVLGGAMAQLRLLALLTIIVTLAAWWVLRRMVRELFAPQAA